MRLVFMKMNDWIKLEKALKFSKNTRLDDVKKQNKTKQNKTKQTYDPNTEYCAIRPAADTNQSPWISQGVCVGVCMRVCDTWTHILVPVSDIPLFLIMFL